jgi:hypothetical protein
VVDDNGTTANATLDVNVVDDLPKAVNDSNTSTASESQLILTGNVLTNDVQGADRVPTGPVTAGTFTGTYGTLELHTDGTYTYTLTPTTPTSKTCTVAATAPKISPTPSLIPTAIPAPRTWSCRSTTTTIR